MSASSSITSTLPLEVDTGSSLVTVSDIHGLPLFAARPVGCFGPRKFNLETRATARTAEHFNGTAVLLNDAVAHREPQASAFARGFGCKERIVDAVQVLLSDAVSRVPDFDPRAALFR